MTHLQGCKIALANCLSCVPCAVEHGSVVAGTTLVMQRHRDCRILYQQASPFLLSSMFTSLLQPYCFALRCSLLPVATRGGACWGYVMWFSPDNTQSHMYNKDFVRSEQKGCQIASDLDRKRNGGAYETGKRPGLQAIARHWSQQG